MTKGLGKTSRGRDIPQYLPRKRRSDGELEADVTFGEILRRARLAAGLSQDDLAKAIGLTFQQVQKYENGANRVSISRLLEMARAVGVAPARLMEDLQAALGAPPADESVTPQLVRRASELARLLEGLPESQQQSLLSLARSMAETKSTAA